MAPSYLSQPSLLFNRSFTDSQSPAGRPVDQGALCWWQPEQQQLWQQPQILAESVWQRRGCGVPAAAGATQEIWDILSEVSWGQQEHKAPALPSHRSAYVEGLWCCLLEKNFIRLCALYNSFPSCSQVDKKRFSLSHMLNKPPSASTQCHTYVREAVLHEELEPGHYLMIPSIYQPGVEARFLIRVFSSSPTTVR